MDADPAPSVSRRIRATVPPVIVATKRLIAEGGGSDRVLSLAQGVVHWGIPEEARRRATMALEGDLSTVSGYGPCEGIPELRRAIQQKLHDENGLDDVDVMVTAGANQAFMNVILSIADADSKVAVFKPYYFNHIMAIQMTEGGPGIVYGPCDAETLQPDAAWLEHELERSPDVRAVVVVTPNNPTGVIVSDAQLRRLAQITASRGVWLVVDNTYENFVYDDFSVSHITGPNVLNIFSFSKCYGMMGWRMGYIAYPMANAALADSLLKVQDTIPICPTQISQQVALGALEAGAPWIAEHVQSLAENRANAIRALEPLEASSVAPSQGAIYLWAKLPSGTRIGAAAAAVSGSAGSAGIPDPSDDEAVVAYLVKEHGVCIIPGSACGAPGYIRVAFANLQPDVCRVACDRLRAGLEAIMRGIH